MTDTPTTPTPSPDAGKVALAEIVAGLARLPSGIVYTSDEPSPGWAGLKTDAVRGGKPIRFGVPAIATDLNGPDWLARHALFQHIGRCTPGTIRSIAAHVSALEAEIERIKTPKPMKRAPVQGYRQGIPWDMHLRAYDAYCARYSPQKALIEGGCRGGFGTEELDDFIPGWRDEISLISALEARALAAEGERDRMREALVNEAAELREVWRALKSVDGNQAHAILPVVWPFLQGIEGRAERLEALTPPTEGETP